MSQLLVRYFHIHFSVLGFWTLITHFSSTCDQCKKKIQKTCFTLFSSQYIFRTWYVFSVTAHLNSDSPHFKCVITSCKSLLPYWTDSSWWRAKQAETQGVCAGDWGWFSAWHGMCLKESCEHHSGNIQGIRLWSSLDSSRKCADVRNR